MTKIKKYGKKAAIGAGILLGIGFCGYKYYNVAKQINTNSVKTDVLYEAASEGLFEQAIATTVRKIDYRKERIAAIEKHIRQNRDTAQLAMLSNYKLETELLENRLDIFKKAQSYYEIKGGK